MNGGDMLLIQLMDLSNRLLNSLIVLGAWTIWRHHNECVFDGKYPRLASALSMAGEESLFWGLAGVRGLPQLAY
jgi:hypothetical protein